jgi:nucleoside 2-deoxyribosyltransferase
VRIYLAGPLFTLGERQFNLALGEQLTAAGHDVWVPQPRESDSGATRKARNWTARDIFQKDLQRLDWAEAVVAIMDGPDPDSGTSWECGYAYARDKPTILVRTDFRVPGDAPGIPYNAMLSGSVDERLEMPFASLDEIVAELLVALDRAALGAAAVDPGL